MTDYNISKGQKMSSQNEKSERDLMTYKLLRTTSRHQLYIGNTDRETFLNLIKDTDYLYRPEAIKIYNRDEKTSNKWYDMEDRGAIKRAIRHIGNANFKVFQEHFSDGIVYVITLE